MPLAAPKVSLGGWSVWPGRDWHGLGSSVHTVPGEEGRAQPVRKQQLCLLCAHHGKQDRTDMAKLQREALHTAIRRGQEGDAEPFLGINSGSHRQN